MKVRLGQLFYNVKFKVTIEEQEIDPEIKSFMSTLMCLTKTNLA